MYVIFGGLIIYSISSRNACDNKLLKIGIISFFALILHNIPEGIITFISSYKDIRIGVLLTLSIALHNIPEGIIIAISIYYSTKSKLKAFLFTLVAALSEPFGSLFAFLFIVNINDYLFGIILALTAGIMLYLAIFEIIKENKKMLY
jgi:ZIP family zinc transporter